MMTNRKYVRLVILFVCYAILQTSDAQQANEKLSGLIQTAKVLDAKTKKPLPYVNIYIDGENGGIISNEQGSFKLEELNPLPGDTICFRHIGYELKKIAANALQHTPAVYLHENIFRINDLIVVPDNFDVVSIVEKVLENRDKNYKTVTSKRTVFVRERSITNFSDFNIEPSRRSPEVIQAFSDTLNRLMNRKFISYTDLMGNYYVTANQDDSLRSKFNCTKAVSLNPDMSSTSIVADSIAGFSILDTDSNEYWKIKSGIFGVELKDERKTPVKDSLNKLVNNDSISTRLLLPKHRTIDLNFSFTNMKNEDLWEFLYKPDRYNFTLDGGTSINDENVYIIRFTPKRKGLYQGRLYITTETYALLRADYAYAKGKQGTSVHLLGVGYEENMYKASVYFEKRDDSYRLKQFSQQQALNISINRPLNFKKKRNRRFIDKTLKNIKTELQLTTNQDASFEIFVIEDEFIPENKYRTVKQNDIYQIHYVDTLNTEKWSDFSRIEPVKF